MILDRRTDPGAPARLTIGCVNLLAQICAVLVRPPPAVLPATVV